MKTSQIWKIASLFDDCIPRTSNMIAKELQLKNSSVSVHLCTLVHKWQMYKIEKVDRCPITGTKAAFYNTIKWIKKSGGIK